MISHLIITVSHYGYRSRHSLTDSLGGILPCLSFSSNVISHLIIIVSHMAIEVDIHDRFTWGILPCLSFSSNVISHLIITVSHMAIEVDIHDRFTWGILPCLSFSSNVISHLKNTVTLMTNSIGESRHVGHSIIRFKSIYFYAVNSLIVQYMHTCIYLTDI